MKRRSPTVDQGPRSSLLVGVRSRASIPAHRRAAGLVEGEYSSMHTGRSLDFDDLREYVVGDDIRDVDWKATARSGRPLVKRYIATRQRSVLLVVDTGRSMAALAEPAATKRQVVVTAAGIIGQLAMRHGDLVGLAAGPVPPPASGPAGDHLVGRGPVGNAARVRYVPPRAGDVHLERMLRVVHDSIDVDGRASDLDGLLEFVSRHVRRRMILVLVIDDVDLTSVQADLLRRLTVRHEILCCTVGDLVLTDPVVAERSLRVVGPTTGVAPFFCDQTELRADLSERSIRRSMATRTTLARLGITSTRLDHDDRVLPTIVGMLDRHRHARSPRRRH